MGHWLLCYMGLCKSELKFYGTWDEGGVSLWVRTCGRVNGVRIIRALACHFFGGGGVRQVLFLGMGHENGRAGCALSQEHEGAAPGKTWKI